MPPGYAGRLYETLDSTNAEAARLAAGLAGPTWIIARQQSAGRGRRGRAWEMPRGNFAGTLVLTPKEAPEVVALRSFVAALALYDTVAKVTGRTDGLALKWPNDVLLNGGKLAGILLESLGAGQGVSHLAIGIGVNLIAAPPASKVETRALRPVSLVSETGADVPLEAFVEHLAAAYAHRETEFCTYGFAPIRAAWLERAAKLGDVITARLPKVEYTGTFETVDAQGNLVLKTAKTRQAIPAADIFF